MSLLHPFFGQDRLEEVELLDDAGQTDRVVDIRDQTTMLQATM